MLKDSRATFLEAIKHFPSWMDIRKRPFKSVGGQFLQSIIEEQNSIQQAIIDYKKDFFILYYIGREHTIIDYLYAAHVGDVGDIFTLTHPNATITKNAKEFYQSTEPIALWQEGYLLFRMGLLSTNDLNVRYSIDGFEYSAIAEKFHVWNVLDEFAMFSGIERYEDETNVELLKRTLLAFKNPTNSTESGLKNAIINSVSNYTVLAAEDIKIETPNEKNLALSDSEFETIYERLAQFNTDVFRTKKWDVDTWEHNFKSLDFLPHLWDAEIDVCQNGVGQGDALQAILTSELKEQGSTSAQITGYQKSQIQIDEYIRTQRIETDLDLTLKKYDNVLKAKDVEYKITASEAKEIAVDDIFLDCYKQSIGESEHYIADLVTAVRGATVIPRGVLDPNSKYRLKFYPKNQNPYSSMIIDKANLVKPENKTESLLVEDIVYKKVNGVFQNTDVTLHATSTRQFKTFTDIVDVSNGVTLGSTATTGSFAVDITGMGGKLLKVGHSCRPVDITKNSEFIKAKGFTLNSEDELVASGTDSTSNITIELDCNHISWELETAANPSQQGSCTVLMSVNDKIDLTLSGLWSSGRKAEKTFSKMSHVKIVIQKAGMNPTTIKNIMASRYTVTYKTEKGGEIIETPLSLMLPTIPADESNLLIVKIESYSAFAPVVNYIHVGASLGNAVYTTKDIVTGDGSYSLDISSNCTVRLYKVSGVTETLVVDGLVTKPIYRNDTTSAAYLLIDTSGFLTITKSTPTIERTTEAGSVVDFIILQPGQELDKIIIEGSALVLLESTSLKKLICPDVGDYSVFVSKALKGFILQNTNSLEESLVYLSRNNLNSFADTFKIKGLQFGITGSFIADKNNKVETIGASFDHNFEELYLFPTESKEYIAYNKLRALKGLYQGISIVNTFMPLLPSNSSLVYTIDGIVGSNITATALFEKTKDTLLTFENWSLGPKTIKIEVDMKQGNSDSYELELKKMNKKFIVSNNINLDAEYEVEGQIIELARYIIVPPDNMKIAYEIKDYGEKVIIEEDGFNKLYYSNIGFVSKIIVEGVVVPTSNYELMNEEGIIIWKNDNYDGKSGEVYYQYKSPKYLAYTSLEHLYALIGYSLKAYRAINTEPITLKNLIDGSVVVVDFGLPAGQYPDKIVIGGLSPNFQAKVENGNVLKITKINIDNVVAVKAGFFYIDGVEYYQFNDKHIEVIDRMSNIDLHNVRRLDNSLLFIQESTNFLLDSLMHARRTGELCIVDFVNNQHIKGLSRIDALTACESYNSWIDFNMDISFKTGVNGRGLAFTADSDNSYAIMDISRFIKPNTVVSLAASGPITIRIAKEVKHRNSSYDKALFAEPYATMKQSDTYQYYVFEDGYDQDYKYFLLLTGTGVIDDIVIKDCVPEEAHKAIHIKNIDSINLSVEERPKVNYLHKLLFDANGNQLDNLELDRGGKLQTGANVDWGLTKIYDARSDWKKCILTDAKVSKDMILTDGDIGIVETPVIVLKNKEAIKSVIVKVNDIMIDDFTDFKITILTSNSPTGTFYAANTMEETNTLQAFRNKLSLFVKVMVEMPEGRVINNLEVFAEYAETEMPLHIKTNRSGNMTTKVFDTGYAATFKVKGLDAKELNLPGKIRVQARACREDAEHAVWTGWKDVKLDSSLQATGNATIFENYRLFQFKIYLDDEFAKVTIDNFKLEVIG